MRPLLLKANVYPVCGQGGIITVVFDYVHVDLKSPKLCFPLNISSPGPGGGIFQAASVFMVIRAYYLYIISVIFP